MDFTSARPSRHGELSEEEGVGLRHTEYSSSDYGSFCTLIMCISNVLVGCVVSDVLCVQLTGSRMAETNDELLDYEEQEDQDDQVADGTAGEATTRREVRGTYVSIHSSGFRDFLLKPELLRAIVDCGFEHPSEGLSRALWI